MHIYMENSKNSVVLQSGRKNDKVKIAVDTEGYYIEGKLRQAINTVTDVKKNKQRDHSKNIRSHQQQSPNFPELSSWADNSFLGSRLYEASSN